MSFLSVRLDPIGILFIVKTTLIGGRAVPTAAATTYRSSVAAIDLVFPYFGPLCTLDSVENDRLSAK